MNKIMKNKLTIFDAINNKEYIDALLPFMNSDVTVWQILLNEKDGKMIGTVEFEFRNKQKIKIRLSKKTEETTVSGILKDIVIHYNEELFYLNKQSFEKPKVEENIVITTPNIFKRFIKFIKGLF